MRGKYIFILLLLVPLVSAEEGHINILATVTSGNNSYGLNADLYLNIHPGSGRVFLDTYPYSKLDTQISTRFAKEIACDFLDMECDDKDFFYVIRSSSPIVGGPSASGAAAVLTVAMLEDLEVDQNKSMTGIINSGGIIGPVGGVKEKIEAAAEAGFEKVIIPEGCPGENETGNFCDYGSDLGIEVVEVTELNEALFEFTGKRFKEYDYDVKIDKSYRDTMKMISLMLCNRSDTLYSEASRIEVENESELLKAEEFVQKGRDAYSIQDHYSAASFCFSANIRLRDILFQNMSLEELNDTVERLNETIFLMEQVIDDAEIKTITDLETYMIVKERLLDSREKIGMYDEAEDKAYHAAYALERIYSAVTWSEFFEKGRKGLKIDDEIMENGCLSKISEAEERYQYISYYMVFPLSGVRQGIENARKDYYNADFELCMFKASKAKAQIDIILSSLGREEEELDELVELKLDAVRKVLNRQAERGVFPILGYSYYEYAQSLLESDPMSALLYAEYSLELSNLEIYFKEDKFEFSLDYGLLGVFAIGVAVGMIVALLILKRKN